MSFFFKILTKDTVFLGPKYSLESDASGRHQFEKQQFLTF